MKLKNKIKLSYWNVKLKNKYTIKTRQKKKPSRFRSICQTHDLGHEIGTTL
jgi:hypothetical protein